MPRSFRPQASSSRSPWCRCSSAPPRASPAAMRAAASPRTCGTTCSTGSRPSRSPTSTPSSSSLVTRLTTDITNVQQAFMLIIRIAVRAPLVLVFAFVMAYAMGGHISFVYLIIIPLLGIGLGLIIHKVTPIFTRVFHKYVLYESVEENVTGMRVVQELRARGLREAEVRHRRPGRLRRLHPRRKAARVQQPDDELLRQRSVRRHHLPGSQAHHHQPGDRVRRGPALVDLHLWLPRSS